MQLVQHDEEKLVVTRALQREYDDKINKINKCEQRLQELENNSGKMNRNLEKNFKNEIDDMNMKQEKILNQKANEMEDLDQNLNVLNQFKDTKTIREENLQRESQRYERLKRELEMLKRNGKIEMQEQKKKIQANYDKNLEDYKAKAQNDAEKNISEIERNI